MLISHWSSYVCSSDLGVGDARRVLVGDLDLALVGGVGEIGPALRHRHVLLLQQFLVVAESEGARVDADGLVARRFGLALRPGQQLSQHRRLVFLGEALLRSEEHTSELQSLMRISYAVFCLKKKT